MWLIIDGSTPEEQRRVRIEPQRLYRFGRGSGGDISIPWESALSRDHGTLISQASKLHVTSLPTTSNPLYYKGGATQTCDLGVDEFFVIGHTTFRWLVGEPGKSSADQPLQGELTFSRDQLQRIRFADPDKRIEVLSRVPELIWGARTDQELHLRLVNLLLAGIPHAEGVALLTYLGDEIQILHWDRRRETAGEIRPSRRLVRDALLQHQQSVLHFWTAQNPQQLEYTSVTDLDWAFCTPIRGTATTGWGLYVTGRSFTAPGEVGHPEEHQVRLQSDVKFAELVAEIVGSVRRLSQLERQQSGLRQFFPPAVLKSLGDNLDLSLLQPREADVTILFCDLRGFSRRSEDARDDLLGLLDRVSQALGVMTQQIHAHGGGVGELLGDAALGFWGWPMSSGEAPVNACLAALGIVREFTEKWNDPAHPMHGFRVGIGIAQGKAVAGKIGTQDHVKVTVFGPVVNRASRLESMTKQIRVPILVDEAVDRVIRERIPTSQARVRRLAHVLPAGFKTPLTVSELLPPFGDQSHLTDEDLLHYEMAVDAFTAGRWDESYRYLHRLPEQDRAQDFLSMRIIQHNRVPPAGWDGVIVLPEK